MGCGDDEDSLSNDIDFHSNHAGSIWYTPADYGGYWLRINNDSSDDYWRMECVRFPVADGTYNNFGLVMHNSIKPFLEMKLTSYPGIDNILEKVI